MTGFEPVKSTGTASSGGSGSKTAESTSAAGAPGSGGTAQTKPAGSSVYLKVFWWNDTERRRPEQTIVSWTGGTWRPNPDKKSEVTTIGPFPVGQTLKLTVYPDGTDGTARVVTFVVRKTLISASARDAIHIELRDEALRVLGNAVANFEHDFVRK